MLNVRVVKVPIELDKWRNIVFDLRSFAELDEIYGSKQKALLSLQSGSLKHVRTWLWAGLLHENQDLSVEDVGHLFTYTKKEAIAEITDRVLQAASANLPQPKADDDKHPTAEADPQADGGWDWDWMYYMGTTLIGMSEEEFWRSTVRKLFALWDVHVRVNGLDKQEEQKTSAPPGYIDQYI